MDNNKELDRRAHDYVQSVKQKMLQENRFHVAEEFNTYLDKVIEEGKTTVEVGTIYYRARRYEESDVYEKWRNGIDSKEVFKGYSAEQSGLNPKPNKPGRCNPKGISYLYAATDIDTAVLEVCNKRNTPVSVAEVRIIKEMTALNLAADIHYTTGVVRSPKELEELEFTMAVGIEIAMEMNRSFYDEDEYILTQYICEYVKNKGIDCVLFQSTSHMGDEIGPREELSIGNNVVVFRKDAYDIVSSNLYLVKNIQIDKAGFKITGQ